MTTVEPLLHFLESTKNPQRSFDYHDSTVATSTCRDIEERLRISGWFYGYRSTKGSKHPRYVSPSRT